MLSRIKSLLFESENADAVATDDGGSDVAAALLIQAALIDGHFSDEERDAIRTILVRDHGASADEADDIMAQAEARVRESAQMFGLTSAINRAMDHDAKISLMETLWEVVLADGVVDAHEGTLMRRLAGLLHVPDRDSAMARQRVIARGA